MNRRSAWLLIGATFVVLIVLLVALEFYFRGGLLTYTIALYVLALLLGLNILRLRRKQANPVSSST